VTEPIDDSGWMWYASLTLGPESSLHVSYLDRASHDLQYAQRTGGSWQSQLVDRAAVRG